MGEEKKLIIDLIQTPECCFVADLNRSDRYSRSVISDLYFDGEKAEKTFDRTWMRIKQFPITVERDSVTEYANERFELEDKDMVSAKFPLIITKEDRENYPDHIIETLYQYQYDILPPVKETVDATIQTILTLDAYVEPSVTFEAIGRVDYSDKIYSITSINLDHQILDKIIFPEICLAHRPCSLSSKQVYDITRQYVLSHIDVSVAKITSNYDFCFTVKKIVPKITPETITYHNIFAKTKKERNKVKTSVQAYTEHEIFQMTHNQSNYQGYTAIPAVFANNESELQEKMDEWLSALIGIINMPLQECPHCKGTGLFGEVLRVNHKVLSDIVTKS